MDTSETYIKMCDCEEIQEHKPIPSFSENWSMTQIDNYFIDNRGNWWAEERLNGIWLPRQDQLQEMMIPEPYRDFRNLLSFFFAWIDWQDDADHNLTQAQSMEQLWLAFAMKEKNNKVWDGERWANGKA